MPRAFASISNNGIESIKGFLYKLYYFINKSNLDTCISKIGWEIWILSSFLSGVSIKSIIVLNLSKVICNVRFFLTQKW